MPFLIPVYPSANILFPFINKKLCVEAPRFSNFSINAFITKEITADSKPKTDVEEEVKELLKTIVALWDEKKTKNSQIKKNKTTLDKKTIETIEGLDMKGINAFLELKWIQPITSAINALPDAIVQSLADNIISLNEKYTVTYKDIEQGIVESEKDLTELINQLTGDKFAIYGLSNLIKN